MELGKIIVYDRKYAPKDWHCDHFIGIHRLYYIHSGEGGCRHNGREYRFRPHTLYLIPFARDFQPWAQGPLLHTFADLELLPPVPTEEVLSAPADDPMSQAALAVFCAGAEKGALTPLCREAMLHLITHLMEQHGVAPTEDPVVLRALEQIHAQFHLPLTVDALAQSCYMNKDSFIRRFAKGVGTTPYAYLKSLRLHTARRLRAEGLPLAEIACRTGYSDPSALLHALERDQKKT